MKRIASLIMGSHLYGLEQPDSDTDEFHIYVESYSDLLRFNPAPARFVSEDQISDITSYSLREVSYGIARGQIGFYTMLWVPDSHIIETSLAWKQLIAKRKEFLSQSIISDTLQMAQILLNRDFRSAAHGLRILYALSQLTQSEMISFPCPIADILLDIGQGKMKYTDLLDHTTRIRKRIVDRKDWPPTGDKIWETIIGIYKEIQNGHTDS